MNEVVNENVSLFYANDEYNNIILINEINEKNKENNFTCPICGGIVKPRAIDSNKISSHYYHLNAKDCSSESVMHYWYKNEFIKSGDKITLKVEDEYYNFNCKEVIIEQSHNTSFGIYRPDATIYTDKGMIFVEYKYSNKKNTEKYIDMWEELNCPIVEIDIKSLMQHKRTDYCFKTIFFDGQIYCKTRNNRINVINKYVKNNNINDRMRIKYLNGLLRDVQRYNLGQIDIEELVMIIDELNEFDLKAFPIMLKKLNCTNILNDYSEYKEDVIKAIIKKECKEQKVNFEYAMKEVCFRYTRKFSPYVGTTKLRNSVVFKVNKDEIGENIYGKIIEKDIIDMANIYLKSIKINYLNYKKRYIKERRRSTVDEFFKKYLFDTYGINDYYYNNYCIDRYSEIFFKFNSNGRKGKYIKYLDEKISHIEKEIKNNNRKKERKIFLSNITIDISKEASKYVGEKYNISITPTEKGEHIVFYCKELKKNIYSMYKSYDILSCKKTIGRKNIIKNNIIDRLTKALAKQNSGIENIKNLIATKENKRCEVKVKKINEQIFLLEWFIITEKRYYKDEIKKMLGEFTFDIGLNKITFAYKNDVFVSYAKDDIEMTLFIEIIQKKMIDYFSYHTDSNKNKYKRGR